MSAPRRWFTADLQLGDPWCARMRYCGEDVDKMDRWLAERWDAKVHPEDEVWVLGDMACGRDAAYVEEWLDARPGSKILIVGNWDDTPGEDWAAGPTWPGFSSGMPWGMLRLGGDQDRVVSLNHYPYGHEMNPEPAFEVEAEQVPVLLHGHTHSRQKFSRSAAGTLQVHVGWDAWRRLIPETDLLAVIAQEEAQRA